MRILYSFGQVDRSQLYLCGVLDDWEEQDICHTLFFRKLEAAWDYWSINSRIVGFHVFPLSHGTLLIAPCNDGSVYINEEGEERWETIGKGPEMPSTLRHLTCSKVIGSFLYVAGMQRQVFRKCLIAGQWKRVDQGALISRTSTEISGFLSIDGVNEKNIYGVGFFGQIWHCSTEQWLQLPSPTNLKLTSVRCMDDNTVYVVGGKGLILKGNKESWTVIEQDFTSSTFVNAEIFQGVLFLVTDGGVLYQLLNDRLSKVDFGCPTDFHFLHHQGTLLLALGFTMAYLFNGAIWAKLDLPQIEAGVSDGDVRGRNKT